VRGAPFNRREHSNPISTVAHHPLLHFTASTRELFERAHASRRIGWTLQLLAHACRPAAIVARSRDSVGSLSTESSHTTDTSSTSRSQEVGNGRLRASSMRCDISSPPPCTARCSLRTAARFSERHDRRARIIVERSRTKSPPRPEGGAASAPRLGQSLAARSAQSRQAPSRGDLAIPFNVDDLRQQARVRPHSRR